MSNTNRHPKWHSFSGNSIEITSAKNLTKSILNILYNEYPKNTYKSVANSLDISLYVVRHWFQGHNNISAFYLYKILINYKSVREYFGLYLAPDFHNIFLRKENEERTREKIVQLIEEDPFLSVKAISSNLNLSQKKVEYIILKLKRKMVLTHVGATKKGKWIIMKKT